MRRLLLKRLLTTPAAWPALIATIAAIGTVIATAAIFFLLLLASAGGTGATVNCDEQAAPVGTVKEGEVPKKLIPIYQAAATRYDLGEEGPAWLAGINKIETAFGTNLSNSSVGAQGWMQFMPGTWATYGVDADKDGKKDPQNPKDAIYAAANYLHASGAPKDWQRAVFAYNHAQWYVDQVRGYKNQFLGKVAAPAGETEDDNAVAKCSSNSGEEIGEYNGEIDPKEVLNNDHIQYNKTAVQRDDIAKGRIDDHVLGILLTMAKDHTVIITALKSDHNLFTSGGNISNHSKGWAVDIGAVDGETCTGTETGNCGRLVKQIAQIKGKLHSTELIYCFDPDGPGSPDGFAQADHCNHFHIGYRNGGK